jgi:catechol 2,3-dioxygenase-like lactoylglutathione lyase family enzyme
MAKWEKPICDQSDRRGSRALEDVLPGGLRPSSPGREDDLAIFRLKDTFVALRHDPAHQAAPPEEELRLAQTGVGQFAIVVEDVDAVGAELEEHGVTFISSPADRAWGMRTLTFADPGGYIWGIAQDLA